MHGPVLFKRLHKQLKLYKKVEVLEERYKDREVYVPVDCRGYYFVVFFVKPFKMLVSKRMAQLYIKSVKKSDTSVVSTSRYI